MKVAVVDDFRYRLDHVGGSQHRCDGNLMGVPWHTAADGGCASVHADHIGRIPSETRRLEHTVVVGDGVAAAGVGGDDPRSSTLLEQGHPYTCALASSRQVVPAADGTPSPCTTTSPKQHASHVPWQLAPQVVVLAARHPS